MTRRTESERAGGPVRVAAYIRASSDESHQPYSLEAQEERLRAFVASQPDWKLVKLYQERKSGATMERPKLLSALADAEAGRFDVLLVYRVDRLARRIRDLSQIIEHLDTVGVAFRSATEPFDTADPAGRMMIQQLGIYAEFERAVLIDRVTNGIERKVARGGWPGGKPGLGYDLEAGALVVNEGEAPVVARMFALYDQGYGARVIARTLDAEGSRTKRGNRWSHVGVLTVLRNPVYVGEISHRGERRPGTHPPVIERDLFERVQARLAANGDAKHGKGPVSEFLLTGLMVCARCGRRYVGTAAHGRSNRYRYYTCWTRNRRGAGACDNDLVRADALEEAVWDALLDLYARPALFRKAVAEAADQQGAGRQQLAAELAGVEGAIRQDEAAIDRYLRAFEAGTMSETICGPRLKELTERVTDLRHRAAELADELADERPAKAPSATELSDIRGRIAAAIEGGSDAHRKLLAHALIDGLRVHGRNRIVPTFRVPAEEDATTVLTESNQVETIGLEPTTPCVQGLGSGGPQPTVTTALPTTSRFTRA